MTFTDLNQNIDFLISRFDGRIGKIDSITSRDITKFIILYGDAAISEDSVYVSMNSTDIITMEDSVQQSINIFNTVSGNYSNTPIQ
jgi:hypothetical protein